EGDEVVAIAVGGFDRGQWARAGRPAVGEVLRAGELLARGEGLDLPRTRTETEARRREIGEALGPCASDTIEHNGAGPELPGRKDRAAPLHYRLPRPLDAGGGSRRGTSTRPTCAATLHPRHAPRDRRGRRGRGGAAGEGADARHDRGGHGFGRRGGAALRRRAGGALLSRRPRARAPAPEGAGPALQ